VVSGRRDRIRAENTAEAITNIGKGQMGDRMSTTSKARFICSGDVADVRRYHPEAHSAPTFAHPLCVCTLRCHDFRMGAVEVVGRDAEVSVVYGYLGRAAYGPTAVVLEGEPGIGKSTLWLAGVEHARSLGCHVLSARPADAEHGLAHVGLGDLFPMRAGRQC
jgi:hypothetical protein